MKAIIVALFAILAMASAGVVLSPSLGYSYQPLAYSAPLVVPSAYSYVAAPVSYAAAPAIQSGYVAATRGSIHTAPLPEGPFAFSHHINTAPAPGTA
ncbi:uncharacterized protein [Diabrotica undecimpunctata]|uniref:uncharacterized protein n=1 Tax=Diabrotica undecimpunctata TaxID=50387 RepID=UPI003B638B22